MRRRYRLLLAAVAAAVLAAVLLVVLAGRGALTESEAQTIVVDTLLRERAEAFVVTGTLEFSTGLEQRSRKVLLPGVLDLDLGTTSVRVRAPARAAYGFDAADVGPGDVRLRGDTVVIALPPLSVFSVEPDFSALELQTETGWARLQGRSGNTQERLALQQLLPAMRARAERYLDDAEQPHANTARAVERILRPAFEAAGVDPVFRFVTGDGVPVDARPEAPAREG